jgi:hypothetical protein
MTNGENDTLEKLLQRLEHTLVTFANLDDRLSKKYFDQFKSDLNRIVKKQEPRVASIKEDLELQTEYCLQNLREAVF